jgi:hypothetical protein
LAIWTNWGICFIFPGKYLSELAHEQKSNELINLHRSLRLIHIGEDHFWVTMANYKGLFWPNSGIPQHGLVDGYDNVPLMLC